MYGIFNKKINISFPVIHSLYACNIVKRNSLHIFISWLEGRVVSRKYVSTITKGYNWVNLQSVFCIFHYRFYSFRCDIFSYKEGGNQKISHTIQRVGEFTEGQSMISIYVYSP